jgi:hypothetical protein
MPVLQKSESLLSQDAADARGLAQSRCVSGVQPLEDDQKSDSSAVPLCCIKYQHRVLSVEANTVIAPSARMRPLSPVTVTVLLTESDSDSTVVLVHHDSAYFLWTV